MVWIAFDAVHHPLEINRQLHICIVDRLPLPDGQVQRLPIGSPRGISRGNARVILLEGDASKGRPRGVTVLPSLFYEDGPFKRIGFYRMFLPLYWLSIVSSQQQAGPRPISSSVVICTWEQNLGKNFYGSPAFLSCRPRGLSALKKANGHSGQGFPASAKGFPAGAKGFPAGEKG